MVSGFAAGFDGRHTHYLPWILMDISVSVLGKDLVPLLKQSGWTLDHVRGFHYVLSKEGQHLSVPVHAGKELGKGLLHELLKKAGLK
jgi:predicted RNA binding protein YcfA (HicA-like mRNA interferase family)